MIEHSFPQIGFHFNAGSEKTDSPDEAADNHGKNNENHRLANVFQQKVHIKGVGNAVDFDNAFIHAVDDHFIQFGNQQLHIIHGDKCNDADE